MLCVLICFILLVEYSMRLCNITNHPLYCFDYVRYGVGKNLDTVYMVKGIT